MMRDIEDGCPLDIKTRASFESLFDHDFSAVRVHTDSRAATSARAHAALAYTVGTDITFAEGAYAPHTTAGARLLAHELTHVVQQSGAADTQGDEPPARKEAGYESEADAVALAATGRRPLPHIARTAPRMLQRAPDTSSSQADSGNHTTRRLTPSEIAGATLVFGRSLDPSRVVLRESSIMTAGTHGNRYYRTVGYSIFVPPKELDAIPIHKVIHELTHCWQYAHGLANLDIIVDAIRAVYAYGGEPALTDAHAKHRRFSHFNKEQQAQILEDYFLALTEHRPVDAFLPFVQEVQGTRGVAPTGGFF